MKEWESSRIANLPPYLFERINRQKIQARSEGWDVIDLGMGNPDLPTPAHIIAKLKEVADDPKAHRYSASKGIKGLRKAIVEWYRKRFSVNLDADKEVVAVIGS
ncbi:MAG: aminotransferase, partial [bacterium (Candidatus Ratteibacteria) CG23_combo_of_CG06-09_8_20_14_all_48_7]